MDLKDIKAIIDLMKKNDLAEFEMEEEGFKIKLRKNSGVQPMINPVVSVPMPAAPMMQSQPAAPEQTPAPMPATAKEQSSGREIVSPMVGTFYRSPGPESPPFVDEGQEVTEESVVCIIEAMKVMNEIKAETKGVISAVLVESGKPVQFGQPLFRLK